MDDTSTFATALPQSDVRGVYHPLRAIPNLGGHREGGPIPVPLLILYAALLLGAINDALTTKIPNRLTFPLIALGIAISVSPYGAGLVTALTGAGVAFALHYALWSIGLEGAGDAKLMMGVGAFVGYATMLEATLWRYVLLLPYAVAVITIKGRWPNFREALRWSLMRARGLPVGERPEPTLMPFGPLIAVAVPAAVHTTWLEFFG
ncbi:MAG TPA: A24 family peptidase [Myxococcota bacterium]|nr:A24 family peptidase [Myxococcota bacterium]